MPWIKLEHATCRKPEVLGIATQLGLTPNAVLGALVRLWCWVDEQFEDGNARTVTRNQLDATAQCEGLAAALIEVKWLRERADKVWFVNFSRHNGQTAKSRALTAKRVAAYKLRSGNGAVTHKARPREDKRREEKKNPSTPFRGKRAEIRDFPKNTDFDQFGAAYPKWKAPGDARKAWDQTAARRPAVEKLVEAITAQKAEKVAKKRRGEFVPEWPYPATWLRRCCWEDQIETKPTRPEQIAGALQAAIQKAQRDQEALFGDRTRNKENTR